MLPPGCELLATRPPATGSATCANTIGIVDVARCIATSADVGAAKITSGLSAASSSAPARMRSRSFSPQRRERAHVHRLRRHVEQMREQAPDLAIEDADELPAPGHRDAEQLLGCQTERVFLVHRRDVIESVEIG